MLPSPSNMDEETRNQLQKQARGRKTPARVVLRSRIVLLAADGLENKRIADKLRRFSFNYEPFPALFKVAFS